MGTLETRKVGSLEVSVAGLGCNNFGMRIDEDASKAVVDAALDAGVNHFDTADIYGGGKSEEFLGRALIARREDVVITTKVGMGVPEGMHGGSRDYVLSRCDASLQRLGTDHIDLYLLHQPDAETPIGETLEAFGELIRAGKVREIGCSNFSAAQLDEAARVAQELGVPGFVNAQNDYSLLNREVEAEVLPAVDRLAMTFMPYFPLASGVLTGKYKRGEDHPEGSRLAAWGNMAGEFASDARMAVVEALDEYAQAHGHTLPELALSWLAGNPVVGSVIAGATKPEQIRANAAATVAWQLTPEERAEVDAIARVEAQPDPHDRAFVVTGSSTARLELVPGPLADLTAPAADGLIAELDRLADAAPRALLVLAQQGVGAEEPRPGTPAGLRDPAAVLAAFPAPTVAYWNGPAVGAGAELLLAADVRIAGPDALLAFPEVGRGELPCWGGTQRLPRLAGIAAALRLLVAGDTFGRDDLVRCGLAEPADDVSLAEDLAERLSRGAPRAQAAARDAVQRGRDLTMHDALRLEADLNLLIATTGDRAEGIAAFLEKRDPTFTGE